MAAVVSTLNRLVMDALVQGVLVKPVKLRSLVLATRGGYMGGNGRRPVVSQPNVSLGRRTLVTARELDLDTGAIGGASPEKKKEKEQIDKENEATGEPPKIEKSSIEFITKPINRENMKDRRREEREVKNESLWHERARGTIEEFNEENKKQSTVIWGMNGDYNTIIWRMFVCPSTHGFLGPNW